MPKSLFPFLIQEAFGAPYLMDQILAFSALLLSLECPDKSDIYRQEATTLQLRALAAFNLVGGGVKFSDFPTTLFSQLVANYQLVETFTLQASLAEFVDRFASYLKLHQGVSLLANMHWTTILERIQPQYNIAFVDVFRPHNNEVEEQGDYYAALLNLLEEPSLCPKSRAAYSRCIELLSWIHGFRHASPIERNLVVRGWSVLIPPKYVELLRQCLPEALVILAHYIALWHELSSAWIKQQTMQFVVGSIVDYLGPDWETWLAYPIQVMMSCEDQMMLRDLGGSIDLDLLL